VITHWTSADPARQTVADGIVEAISPALVRRILQQVDLQPHRTRYWRMARLDERFKERAEKVLWCYGNAERLACQGVWVVCTDEVPNLQVLEREPLRPDRRCPRLAVQDGGCLLTAMGSQTPLTAAGGQSVPAHRADQGACRWPEGPCLMLTDPEPGIMWITVPARGARCK
jgi:hypothetical protein